MKRTLLLFLFILHPIGVGLSVAQAVIYKYIDENGVICYTNSPFGKKAEMVISAEQRQSIQRYKNTLDYSSIVYDKATKYNIDPSLIKAIIKAESNWNPAAISKKGAIGLMQLMPFTAREMNVRNPFNPEDNIEGGVKYFKLLLKQFNNDLTLALAAYNAGPRTVERFGFVPPITETRQYVSKVLHLYNGKKTLPVSGGNISIKEKMPKKTTTIYKVVLEDGTILFTNSTLLLKMAYKR